MESIFYDIMRLLVGVWFQPPLSQLSAFLLSLWAALAALKIALAKEWGIDEFFASQDEDDPYAPQPDWYEDDEDMMDAAFTDWHYRRSRGYYSHD
jgi:hypothetical protein